MAKAIKFSFGLMEGVLLITGTLVWRFTCPNYLSAEQKKPIEHHVNII